MSEFMTIMSRVIQDTQTLIHDFFYYTGLSSPEYWKLLSNMAFAYLLMNTVAAFLVAIMRKEKICPEILNKFPYRIIFPQNIVSTSILLTGYVLVFVVLPKAMIQFLGA